MDNASKAQHDREKHERETIIQKQDRLKQDYEH